MQKYDESAFIVYGAVKVTLATHMVFLHGEPIHLAKMEFCLLCYLLQYQGRVLSRQQILSEVWNSPADLKTRTVDIHICNLRKKLNLDSLKTVVGIGYKLQPSSKWEKTYSF